MMTLWRLREGIMNSIKAIEVALMEIEDSQFILDLINEATTDTSPEDIEAALEFIKLIDESRMSLSKLNIKLSEYSISKLSDLKTEDEREG